ncbi:MAG: hypothetical protein ACI828_001663 [Flavobacteriales bacterium]|jgi:hypothetical protein
MKDLAQPPFDFGVKKKAKQEAIKQETHRATIDCFSL